MKGFTLIELLIYLAIFSLLTLVSADFFWQAFKSSQQNFLFTELQDNGNFSLKKISQTIRQAESINQPATIGQTSDFLSLVMANPALNPTVFQIQNNQLMITLGTQGPYALTTEQVRIVSLNFTNLSYQGTAGLIKTTMELKPSSSEQPSLSLLTSASLR